MKEKTREHRTFSSVNFWWPHVKTSNNPVYHKRSYFSTVLVRFFSLSSDAKKLNRLNCIQITNQNQPNKQTTSTEPLYGKSIKRHSGLKHFTVSWFYSLFLEISNDDLSKGKIKFKKSQKLYGKKLNLRV